MVLGTWQNPYGAQGGGLPSSGDLSMFGGGSVMGPWMFAGMALSGLGSWMGARAQAQGMKAAAAQSRAQAAEDRAHNAVMQREGLWFGEGQNIANAFRQDMYNQVGFRREKEAKKWSANTLMPIMGNAMREQKRLDYNLDAYDPAAQSLRRQKNRDRTVQLAMQKGFGTMSSTTPWGTQHSFPVKDREAFRKALLLYGA